MEFLSSLHTDVRLLLVGGALALLGGLLCGSKKMEHRYLALFTLLMVAAGYRFHVEQQGDALAAGRGAEVATHSSAKR